MMLSFVSKEKAEQFASNPGDRIKILYTAKVDPNGQIDLIEDGQIDIQDQINSYAESCDMRIIVRRFLSGEVDVLSKVQGFYADITRLPKSYPEFLQRQIDANKAFLSLPADVRSKFGNDVQLFTSTAGEQSWFERLGVSANEFKSFRDVSSRPPEASSEGSTN